MKTLRGLLNLIALFSAAFGLLAFKKNKVSQGAYLSPLKLIAGALQPFVGLTGLLCALFGSITRAWPAVFAGILSYLVSRKYLIVTTALPQSTMSQRFERAFGPHWSELLNAKCSPQHKAAMLRKRWRWILPKEPEPIWLRDIPYWTDPHTGRTLFCDLWSPNKDIPHTGLGLIYFHGSAWCLGDKDLSTRDFFRHLTAQGHVVMDAQYRLIPETDMAGMVADGKRALAWLKTNAELVGVNPQRLVTAGFSSGGQLALLVAYAVNVPALTPPDLLGKDLSVCGTTAYAGSYDLCAIYFHNNRPSTPYEKLNAIGNHPTFRRLLARLIHLCTRNKDQAERISMTFANLALAGQLQRILGGAPHEIPDIYTLYSPITYAGPLVPPTFIVQSTDDMWAPVECAYEFCGRLQAAGIPVVNLVLPHGEHGFDLVLPRISPPAQSTQYEVDRFLGFLQEDRSKLVLNGQVRI